MSNIQNMDIQEIIKIIGANIRESDFSIVFNNNEEAISMSKKVHDQIRENQKAISRMYGTYSEAIPHLMELEKKGREKIVTDFFIKYQGYIDKEKFILITLHNSLEDIEEGRVHEKSRDVIKRKISKGISLLKKISTKIILHEGIENSNLVRRVRVIDSEGLMQTIKRKRKISTIFEASNEKKDRLNRIEEMLEGLGTVIFVVSDDDISSTICTDADIGEAIYNQISHNTYTEFINDNDGLELRDLADENGDLLPEYESRVIREGYEERAKVSAIRENLKYIDIDKLLLCIGYRMIDVLENDPERAKDENGQSVLKTEPEESIEFFKKIIGICVSEIGEDTKIDDLVSVTGEEVESYCALKLKNDFSRFKAGRYVSTEEIKEAKFSLIKGIAFYEDIPPEVIVLLGLTEEEFIRISISNERNMLFLIREDIRKKEEIYELLSMMGSISDEILLTMQEKGYISYEKIIDFFEKGKINASQVRLVINEIDEEWIYKKLKEEYLRMQKLGQDNEEGDRELNEALIMFNRYAELYRMFFKDKSEEEMKEIENRLIGSFEDELSNEMLQRMYQNRLISLDTMSDWGANIMDMLSSNQIKANDLRMLYNKGRVSLEQIKIVILHGEGSIDEKQDLIYSTFDGESTEEEEIRDELINLLNIGETYKDEHYEKGERRKKTIKSTTKKEYVTDPQTRWKLLSLLDRDYSRNFLPDGKEVRDGHRVFLLPNQNQVVIEKMYEKKKGTIKSSYGSATYIMDTNDFYDNINDIIKGGAIDRKSLISLSGDSKATRITHSKFWGNSIMKHFGINESNERYTKEDINAIKQAADRVVSSRRERG